ncbi:TRAP transporter substrate-binding protein DctP [Pseudonocardia halophobica]|uniref:TRAP transporter substrate-binding protein DctP n=1 Tax=Pseudonocardia halophobica TaxID=29401 RepID=UPI003D8FEB15
MRKTRFGGRIPALLAAGLAAGLLATGCASGSGGGAGSAETYDLSFSSFAPETNPSARVSEWFMSQVEERSGGRITFTRNWLEAGCPAAELYQCVNDGRADVVFSSPTYEPQKLPITLISAVPFVANSTDEKAQAFYELYQKQPALQQEYESSGMRLLGLWSVRLVLGSQQPIDSMADIQGKSLRATGDAMIKSIREAGGNPVTLTVNEVYESLQRGVISGYGLDLASNINYNLYEQVDHLSDPNVGGFSPINLVISQGTYESMDDEAKQIIDQVSRELSTGEAVRSLNQTISGICDQVLKTDLESYTVWSEAATAEWRDRMLPELEAGWKATAGEAGVADVDGLWDAWSAELRAVQNPVEDAEVTCAKRFAQERGGA